jgi:precorrin-2 dehydrogenase/sirohydrochlorin ferrochelatase
MPKYPIYLELKDKQAVVIGAGSVAARKTKTLVATGAAVRVVAKNIEPVFEEICQGLDIELIQDSYRRSYIEDAFLAVAATNNNQLNTEIFEDCQALKVLCNVVDVPHLCNFYVPAVIRQGDLQIAISTNGKCPAYAGHLRRKFQTLITEENGKFLDLLDEVRQQITSQVPAEKRKELLSKLADDQSFQLFLDQGQADWKSMAQKLIEDYRL